MIEKGKELLKIHDLGRLQDLGQVQLSDENMELILVLNRYYLHNRYPDLHYKPLPNPDDQLTKKLFNKTDKLYLWLIKHLEKL